jgi:hypothetical protein
MILLDFIIPSQEKMNKFYKACLTVLFVAASSFSLFAQNNFFIDQGANVVRPTSGQRAVIPKNYRVAILNTQSMKNFLWSLPAEQTVMNRNLAPVMELPMPDGKMARFRVWESNIMEPGLARKFPEMRTFAGQGIDDPYASVRFDYNPYFGFSAQILSVNGRIYVDPYARRDIDQYISYYARDNERVTNRICYRAEDEVKANIGQVTTAGPCRGTQLYTYRLALACTGEYAVAVCSPNPASTPVTAAAMLTSVNRVTGVYESEASIRMVLIANNDNLIYLDGTTDPYSNNSGGAMLGQNQANIDAVIGTANYDIGHVFSTGGGGVAVLNGPCNSFTKARGVTGLSNPVGDNYDIDYVAHEMGHQFGADHSFNSEMDNCGGGNRAPAEAYEVGSGTTIMAYAGICLSDNTQLHSDPFFHSISFDRISNFVEAGGSCRLVTPTGNILPVITAMNDNGANIPIGTPFTLTGAATDANGDALTYSWEEWDLGPATVWNGGNANTTSPLFKARIPKTSGSRTFPDMAVILANYPANPPAAMGGLKGETLPTQARALKFRLTVRDSRAGGGGIVSGGDGCQAGFTSFFQINTIAGTGPFVVTAPNGGENYPGGSTQTITWNVAGTDAAPISVANVRITLSTDGGLTYPTVLTASTPNDGSEALAIPGVLSNTARIKIEALGNIFFDISNLNFIISAPVADFTFSSPAPAVAACPAPATMNITLGTFSNGGFITPINLTFSGNPAGTSVAFVPNPVIPGNSTVVTLTNTNTLSAGSYVITVTGTAGPIIRTRDLTFTISPGAPPVINTPPAAQTACVGADATFSVSSPGGLTYQWQVSVNGGGSFSNISGAVSSSYTATAVTAAMNNNQYRVIVTGQCGAVTSSAATLTVNTAPAITGQPQDITLCAGSNHIFTSTATGSNLTYQWQVSTDGGAIYSPLTNAGVYSGTTTSSLTITGITAGLNNNRYRVVVTGSCTPPATSNGAILTVVTSVTITGQPANATVCAGSNTTFTVAGSGSGIIYQWQVSTDGGSVFTNIANGGVYSGAATATLTITGATVSMNNYQYRAQLSNATCPTPGISGAAILTVNTLPAISSPPSNATICVGGGNTFSVTASGTGITYQWQVSVNSGASFSNIVAATSSTYSISGATASMNGNQYRVVVSGTCAPAVNSANAVLTVVSPVVIVTQPANTEVCSGSTTNLTVVGNSTEPIVYQWQVSTSAVPAFTNIPGATGATLSLPSVIMAMNGNKYRVLVSNATCSTPTTSAEATLTVRQLPSATLVASPGTSLLPGQTTTLTATSSASTGGVISSTWLHNGNAVNNTGNIRVVNVDSLGTYQIRIQEVWTTITCTNTSSVITIDAPASSRLFIFPSPNSGQFTVAYYNPGGAATQQSISIFDSKGAMVYNRKLTIIGPYELHKINLLTAGRGIYYVVIGDANGKKLADGKVIIH